MKKLKNGDNRITKLTKCKSIKNNATLRLSEFVYMFCCDNQHIVKNTFTGEVVRLNEREWDSFSYMKDNIVDYNYLLDNGLLDFAVSRYIVEKDYDEAEKYKQTVTILKMMSKNKPGLRTYTIFPTTGCNARCVYCYEQGYQIRTMTRDTADRLIDFICETRHEDEITLSWFGGEPMAAHETISYICQSLADRGIPYKSRMITNASLFTKDLARKAKSLWNLKKVQVSLDGDRADYEIRKNYYAPDRHNYDTVMKAIHYLANEGIKVSLRVNFDWENLSRLKGFLDEIKAEFGDMENISLHLAMIYQEQHKDTCVDLYRKMFELNKYINDIGIPQGSKSGKGIKLKLNSCMADSMDKSIVIDPDGNFYNCEHLPENNTWGNIFDGITDKARFDELSKPADIDEKCRHCCFLPQCTPFYKRGCPGWFEYCCEYNCLKTEYSLQNLIKFVEKNGEGYDENI